MVLTLRRALVAIAYLDLNPAKDTLVPTIVGRRGAWGRGYRKEALRSQLEQAGLASSFYESKIRLSMGMSADFHIAGEEGADLVRVGTAVCGDRPG